MFSTSVTVMVSVSPDTSHKENIFFYGMRKDKTWGMLIIARVLIVICAADIFQVIVWNKKFLAVEAACAAFSPPHTIHTSQVWQKVKVTQRSLFRLKITLRNTQRCCIA